MSEPSWELLGGGGVIGGPIDYVGAWAAGTTYQPGQIVRYNGVDYLAVKPSVGQVPPPATNWVVPTTVGAIDESVLTVDNPGSPPVWKVIPATFTPPYTDTGWLRLGIDIAYTNSAADYASPYGTAGATAIRRLSTGLVVGRGLMTPAANNVSSFTIPAGLRPATLPNIHIIGGANNIGPESARIPTLTGLSPFNTQWGFHTSMAGISWISLAGALWMAEQ
jgi:hypothetical protein